LRILLTGISGAAGSFITPLLLDDGDVESVVGLDARSPDLKHRKLSFIEADVRDPGIGKHFEGIDTVVHLAFIVREMRNKKAIYDINVNGSRNVLKAARGKGVRKLVVASSVSAYGNHPDNPDLIYEDMPLRGNRESYYSHTKMLVEKQLDSFERQNGDIVVTRLRPSIFCGPNCGGRIMDYLNLKVLIFPRGRETGVPIVHERDVARAFYLAIKNDVPGAFNISAGSLSVREISRIVNMPSIAVPYRTLKTAADILYFLGIISFSSHWLVMARYPSRYSVEKARDQLGWEPEYGPAEAFEEMYREWRKRNGK